MRAINFGLPLALALTMAACGEDPNVQNTGDRNAPPETTKSVPQTPPRPQSTQAPRPAPEGTTGSTARSPQKDAARLNAQDQPLSPGLYRAEPVDLRLNNNGQFVLIERDGTGEVRGSYEFRDGILILRDPTGDTKNAQFPINCRAEANTDGFTLRKTQASCPLDGLTFNRVS